VAGERAVHGNASGDSDRPRRCRHPECKDCGDQRSHWRADGYLGPTPRGRILFRLCRLESNKLEITASGFQKILLTGLKLDVATTVTKNVSLTIGNSSQIVEVVATAPLVDVSTNEIGQVINDKTVQQIP